MIRRISNNLGNLILSIVLAVLVWIVAVQETYPNIDKTLDTPIPIVAQNQPGNMVVYDESARTVRITVSAPQSSLDVLTPDRIAATIDLSHQPSGTLELPVQVAVNDRFVRVTKIEPSIVRLKMEPLDTLRLPATINVVGTSALGYAARPVTTTPMTIAVRGPASLVQRVVTVDGQLSIQDARATVSQTVGLTARASDGQPVPNITLTPSTTLAIVPVQQLGGFRDLAVKIDLRGNVASGYLIANVSVNPQIATVFGSPTTLDALPGFISTEPVSVTNATGNLDKRVRLDLPSGVSMLGDPFVQVSVQVEPIESSLTLQRTPITQGLQPGLTARLSPELVDVIVSGPVPILDTLRADDVQVILNLLNLDIGAHQLTPEVSVPNGLTVVSVLPATIQVVISEAITPTGTITATTLIALPVPSPLPTPKK